MMLFIFIIQDKERWMW